MPAVPRVGVTPAAEDNVLGVVGARACLIVVSRGGPEGAFGYKRPDAEVITVIIVDPGVTDNWTVNFPSGRRTIEIVINAYTEIGIGTVPHSENAYAQVAAHIWR